MNENENLTPVKELTPFTRMIMTIGTLPSSFYASMSYYESMVWLYEYLKNEVIPAVNNNGEAVEELQAKFLELKSYIDTYFDNLDVQEEVNKKLDEMALDGTLTNLIKGYVDPIYEAYENEINDDLLNFKNDINGQFDNFETSIDNQIATINGKVSNLVSGSPKGVYDTLSDLETADPSHDYIYLVLADGKWYYYDTSTTTWTAGGTYQSTSLGDNEIHYENLDNDLQNNLYEVYFNKKAVAPTESGIMLANGTIETHSNFKHYSFNVTAGEKYYIENRTAERAVVYLFKDENDDVVYYKPTESSSVERYINYVVIPSGVSKLFVNCQIGSDNLVDAMVFKRNAIFNKIEDKPLKNNYVIASVDDTTGELTRTYQPKNSTAITNITPIYLEKGQELCSAYKIILYKYANDGTFIEKITTDDNFNHLIEEDGYYRIVAYNTNNKVLVTDYNIDSLITDNLANAIKINKKYNNQRYIHISFDDVHTCLKDLITNGNVYKSIFENNFLNDLKEIHDLYGAVFTLNTFNTYEGDTYDITAVPTVFKQEFNYNSNWLKFSFHAENQNSNYSTDQTSAIITSFNKFVNCVESFAGDNCIDKFARLGYFSGTSANIDSILTNTKYRLNGLLTADDTRLSYYLNQTQTNFINANLYGYDNTKNLYFIKSQVRLEEEPSFNFVNDRNLYILELFTHEYAWTNTIKSNLETILESAREYNYKPCYFDEIFMLRNNI